MKSRKTFRHLHLEERQLLELYVLEGKSKSEIARLLVRSLSTIKRELKRNEISFSLSNSKLSALERAKLKDEKAKARWRRSKVRCRIKSPQVREHIIVKLLDNWSPEQIAGSLGEYFPGASITAKTIYNFVKYCRPELLTHLRRKGIAYRQRVANRRSVFRVGAPEKRSISERPESVFNREEPGHWEGDTVVSKRGGSRAVLTLVERQSRKRIYFMLPDLKAESVLSLLLPFFRALPSNLRKSLTLDNGSEFAPSELKKLETAFKNEFKLYYCHPYKAYERGSVENANGWLRQYFPKGTDFSKVSREELRIVQSKLNARPMKLHKWRSATQVYEQIFKAAA